MNKLKGYLRVHLSQSEKQQHALFVVRGTFGCAGLKLFEQEVQLILVEQLCQLCQHTEHIDPHCLKSVRLHSRDEWGSSHLQQLSDMHKLAQAHVDWK